MQDVEAMRSPGLALGGSLDNAIVLDETACSTATACATTTSSSSTRCSTRSATLSARAALIGQYTAFKSGHALNNALARALLARTDAWEMVAFDTDDEVPSAFQDWAAIGAA